MKISYNWLKSIIDIPISIEMVEELLTSSGLEVEGVEKIVGVPGGLEGLLVGEVMEVKPHPEADRLQLTKVNVGEEELLSIVCGAPNVAIGQKVIVATVGTTLYPLKGEPFKIKKSKIRGQVSEGMICAEDEIGIGESHDGIMVLDAVASVGTTAASYFKMPEDYCIEIGLTPNRADAMSHFGVARDLLVLMKVHGHVVKTFPNLRFNEEKLLFQTQNLEKLDVAVENQTACPRYCGLRIDNIKVGPSPDWLQQCLKVIGLKPINNVVDITNYILHGYGQPLHAFDFDKMTGKKVLVKTVNQHTVFTTLDEEERKLSNQDLMICNADEPMCIAGVFGGLKSGVSNSTTSIFLESAYFHPVWVRKTAKRHGLSTDASYRFERGIDPNITKKALIKAANLIGEICGGQVSSFIFDSNPNIGNSHEVIVDTQKLNTFLGTEIPESEIDEILQFLDIEFLEVKGSLRKLKVPAYRNDVLRPADIYEEVLRIYGFDRVELPEKHQFSVNYDKENRKDAFLEKVLNQLASIGFSEAMSNSLTSSKYYDLPGNWAKDQLVVVRNPLSSELDVMRQTLLFNALETVAYNLNRQENSIKITEFGTVFFKQLDNYVEKPFLSLAIAGIDSLKSWRNQQTELDFFKLKGMLEFIFKYAGISPSSLSFEEIENKAFESGMRILINKKEVGLFGEVGAAPRKAFDIKKAVYYAEIDWQAFTEIALKQRPTFKAIPKFPSVERDLSLLVDKAVSYAALKEVCEKTDKRLLKFVHLFDLYEGKGVPEGKRVYGLNFIFRDEHKTLTDNAIDAIMQQMIKNLEQKLGAILR